MEKLYTRGRSWLYTSVEKVVEEKVLEKKEWKRNNERRHYMNSIVFDVYRHKCYSLVHWWIPNLTSYSRFVAIKYLWKFLNIYLSL